MIAAYRRMTPAQKLARVAALTEASRQLAAIGIRERFPDASAREVALRLAAMRFDRETMIRAFGWDPREH